jgi:hypothetical protein
VQHEARSCLRCSTPFITKTARNRFCSTQCREEWHQAELKAQRPKQSCEVCGTDISHRVQGTRYCSIAHQAIARRDRIKHDPEARVRYREKARAREFRSLVEYRAAGLVLAELMPPTPPTPKVVQRRLSSCQQCGKALPTRRHVFCHECAIERERIAKPERNRRRLIRRKTARLVIRELMQTGIEGLIESVLRKDHDDR